MIEEAAPSPPIEFGPPVAPDERDRRALLEVLALAFRDNPMNVRIHGPRPAQRVRANRAGLRALVLDIDRETVTRVIHHEGRVVGGLIAAPPGQFPLSSPSFWRLVGCFVHQGPRAMDEWSRVNAALVVYRPPVPHWYLAVLGVLPEWQGRGVGGRLLEALIERAVADRAPIYLESDRPESVDFYRARGFVDRGHDRVHTVDCWCLEWDPDDAP